MQKKNGFTLVELLIVVVIIGILAAMAIPIYRNYTTRAKVSEVLTLGRRDSLMLTEYHENHGQWPTQAQAGQVDLSPPAASEYLIKSQYQASPPSLIYQVGNLGPGDAKGEIIFQASAGPGSIRWDCHPGTGAQSFPKKYLPRSCRQ